MTHLPAPRRRGRPPKIARDELDTRQLLIRCGMAVLTEQGLSATGLDLILKRARVPKGSFYHYFDSKEAFGQVILAEYGQYFERKLRQSLDNETLDPLARLEDFVAQATAGMARHGWRRGCLVGNLGQEVMVLPSGFRVQLEQILGSWQGLVSQCLQRAQAQQLIPATADCDTLAAFFWIGWEGAVMRARLCEGPQPLTIFLRGFLAGFGR